MSHGADVDTADTGDAHEMEAFDDVILLDVVDLSDVTAEAVAGLPESVLAFALRRIRRETLEGPDVFSNDYEEEPPAPL